MRNFNEAPKTGYILGRGELTVSAKGVVSRVKYVVDPKGRFESYPLVAGVPTLVAYREVREIVSR